MARTKNRFNAVAVPETVSAGAPVKKTKTFRVALYARLSVELKARPSESIANQLDIMREFIKGRPEFAEYHEYVDSAVSGTSFNRPSFNRMMDDVRDGKISCIIVKDMSRFGRDYIEAGNYIETIFLFLGVRFISINDHFDTEAEFNQNKSLEIALKNLVNDMYAKDISKRVAVSRRLDMERGKFTGSNAPYGYKVDSTDPLRKYLVDEEAAAVVRQIFELAAEGVTLREIAKALQNYRLALPGEYLKSGKLYVEEGQEAKAWYAGTISNILKNQAYIGNMVQGKRRTRLSENEARHFTEEEDWIVVENTHEPIVDKELFDKVRKVLGQKVEESSFASERGKNLPVKDDIFAGILFCGNCKKRLPQLSRIIEKDGRLERQYFYACRYNYDFGGEKCGCTILEQELVRAVHKILEVNIATLTESEKTEAVVKGVMDKNLKQCDGQIRKLEKLIEKQNYEESKAYQRYVTGEVSKEDFKRMQEKSADAVMRLRGQISDEQAKYRRFKRFFEKKLQWLRAIYRFQSEPYLDRNMLEILVHSIYLYPDNRMEINLNFKDEYAEMMKEEA